MDTKKIKTILESVWSIKYMPEKVEDLAATEDIICLLNDCIDKGTIPNHLCFYGRPGTGKNSIVNILTKNLDIAILVINASEENGIETIRTKIMDFAKTGAFFDKPKIIVLNEADGLSSSAQDALREQMETSIDRCRFILTCNKYYKLIEPFHSRLSSYKLDPPLLEVVKRLAKILKLENVKFDKDFLVKFVKIKGRDLRKLLNDAQTLSKIHETLTTDILGANIEEYVDFFDELFKHKDLKAIGEKIKNQLFDDDIYTILADYCIERNYPSETILIIADHLFRSQSIFDKDVIFMSCFLSLKKVLDLI